MSWSPQQLEGVYANVFGNVMTCPACGGRLVLAPLREEGVTGLASCQSCGGQALVSMRDDPLRCLFRSYSEQEKRAIIAADKSRQTPTCPVDGTVMDVSLQRSLGRTSNVVVRCRRCAQSHTFTRAHG
jgi:transcription elongation factor Elf1